MVYEKFQEYGVENFVIIELGRYEVEDKQELRKHEQEWIENVQCCNMMNAFGVNHEKRVASQKRYKESEKARNYMKEYQLSYREKNRDKIYKYQKEYRKTYQETE